jgi:hypothetical protein
MGIPIPPVFWKKRLQSIENKRQEPEKERQESSRGGKRLDRKEMEEVEEVKENGRGLTADEVASETKVRRTFTGYDRTDCRSCQYIKWVLVFRD